MARAKLGLVQIRLTLLDAEGLSARVKTESIQYEFKTTASCRVSLICTSPGLALAMPFLHSFHL